MLFSNQSIAGKVAWRARKLVLSRPAALSGYAPADSVIVAGLMRTASGIGQSARACADGLEKIGMKVTRVDLSAAFNQVDLPSDERYRAEPDNSKTMIVHLNAPEFERACFLLGNWRFSGRRVIGYWAWELPSTPAGWSSATRWLSEIWVPSHFTRGALKPLTGKPIRVVPHYISQSAAKSGPRPANRFRCIAFGDSKSSFERKNLVAAVEAFRAADLPDFSELVVKTRGLAASPRYQNILREAIGEAGNIRVIDQPMAHDDVIRLIADSDVLISLHRSEGFGLTIAEAMLHGKAVVVTGWSGNMDYLDERSAVLVPAALVPVRDSCGVYAAQPDAQWADPDIQHASRALTRLAADPAALERLGEAARQQVAQFKRGDQYLDALGGGIRAPR